MTRPFVKFCGMTRESDALEAARLRVDAIGLNFWSGSPRFVSLEQARAIARSVAGRTLRVGIFVDETAERVREIVEHVGLDAVQLHGNESPQACAALAPLEVIKAVRVDTAFDAADLSRFPCRTFLLDGSSSKAPGGTGTRFDWDRARGLSRYGRIVLAGGLEAGNVAEALERARPWGVDAASGIERRPGVKDPRRMRGFMEAVRRWDAAGRARPVGRAP